MTFLSSTSLFCEACPPPPSSSSLCHCCRVTQTLQRCYIWTIRRMSHTQIRRRPALETFLFLHLNTQTQTLQTDLSLPFIYQIGLCRQRAQLSRSEYPALVFGLLSPPPHDINKLILMVFSLHTALTAAAWEEHALAVNLSVCCSSSSHSFCPSVSLVSFCSIGIGRRGVWDHLYT